MISINMTSSYWTVAFVKLTGSTSLIIETSNQNVESSTSVINNIINTSVPLSRDSPCHFPKSYTFELKRIRTEKNKLYIIWLSSWALADKIEFKKLRANCLRLPRKLYSDFVETTKCSMKRNFKYFWSFVKRTKNDTRIPSSMRLDDVEASDGDRNAQLFSTHFKSVYRPSVCTPIVRNDSPTFVDNLHITAAMLESSITNLKENNLALMVFLPFL